MSKLVLNGDVSGSVTLDAPSAAGTTTLTLPTTSGTVLTTASTFGGTGPAFSAYANTTVSAAVTTFVKLLFQVEDFDTNNNFASSRFTPTVAGYYQINGMVTTPASPASGILLMSLYKNGSRYLDGNSIVFSSNTPKSLVSALIYLDGSTDYVELYGYQSSAATINLLGNGRTEGYFQGFLARSA
jgi:hypothetical protein